MTVFISKGDKPLTTAQATTRGLRYYNSQLASWQREAAVLMQDPQYLAWAAQWLKDNAVNSANNQFNNDLLDYKKAIARVSRYRLADGRAEVIEQVETGELNEDFEPVTEGVVTITAIDPLEVQIEQTVINEAGEKAGTEMVANPLIVQDDAERAEAQAAIASTPKEVIDFYKSVNE